MSIKKLGQQIKMEAEEFILSEYGNKEGFKVTIGQKNLVISTYNKSIELKRWQSDERNHHCYVPSGKYTGSYWLSTLSEREEKILTKGLEFLFKYMEQYALIKKKDGFVVVQEMNYQVEDWVQDLLRKVDKSNLSIEEKKYASNCFSLYVEKYISGSLEIQLENYIHNLCTTAKNIKEVVNNNPLCVMEESAFNVIDSYVEMTYHGEKITISNWKKENEIHVKCENLQKDTVFLIPLQVEQLEKVLDEIQEGNKFKNLISPSPVHFKKFIKYAVVESFSDENIEEEFKSTVSYFKEDWKKVELLFNELIPLVESYQKDKLLKKIVGIKDNESRMEIEAYKFDVEDYTFSLVVHSKVGDVYKNIFKLFVQERGDELKTTDEYVINFIKEIMKFNKKNLV